MSAVPTRPGERTFSSQEDEVGWGKVRTVRTRVNLRFVELAPFRAGIVVEAVSFRSSPTQSAFPRRNDDVRWRRVAKRCPAGQEPNVTAVVQENFRRALPGADRTREAGAPKLSNLEQFGFGTPPLLRNDKMADPGERMRVFELIFFSRSPEKTGRFHFCATPRTASRGYRCLRSQTWLVFPMLHRQVEKPSSSPGFRIVLVIEALESPPRTQQRMSVWRTARWEVDVPPARKIPVSKPCPR